MSRSPQNPLAAVSNANNLAADEYHDLLAVDRRRLAIEALSERAGPIDVDELAVEVATRTAEFDADDRTDVEHIAITLHHVHLPKMAELDVVEYEAENGVVELR